MILACFDANRAYNFHFAGDFASTSKIKPHILQGLYSVNKNFTEYFLFRHAINALMTYYIYGTKSCRSTIKITDALSGKIPFLTLFILKGACKNGDDR